MNVGSKGIAELGYRRETVEEATLAGMINLSTVKALLGDVQTLVDGLDGVDLNEEDALTSQSKGRARQERARKSQDLNLLAHRLRLAAELVQNEYWYARGEGDPLQPRRRD